MKLVSFNIWSATQGEPLFEYLKELKPETEIFCLQEIFNAESNAPELSSGARLHVLHELQAMMPEYNCYYAASSMGFEVDKPAPWPVSFGKAVFVKKSIPVQSYASYNLFDTREVPGTSPEEGYVVLQALGIEDKGKNLHVLNFHGMSRPGTKIDTPERIVQSQRLLDVLATLPPAPTVLCGDFNLYPDTQSIGMLDAKLRNLIKEYKITNTRNEVSWRKFNSKQYFADYTFVSPDVQVKNFEVPYNEVSDHLPMILDFSV